MPKTHLQQAHTTTLTDFKKMGSYALALSHSKPFIKSLGQPLKKLNCRFGAIFQASFLKPTHHHLSHHANILSFPSSSLPNKNKCGDAYKLASRRLSEFKICSATEGGMDEGTTTDEKFRTLQLGCMFAIWYLLNIYFNIYNKQVLKVYPFPMTVTAFQFGCGTVLIFLMWSLRLHPTPKLSRSQLGPIFLLALGHTAGNLLTNISIGTVAVSFTHTIKAMEPFFTVLLAALFLGENPSIWVVASLIPVVGGVALASFTEASFNWIGFNSAMASNLTNQTRNIFSKKLMVKMDGTLDNITLFSIITIISFLLLAPAAILQEGVKFSPSYLQYAASQGLNVKELCIRSLLSGFCFHTYQQVSYMILQMVSPVTHAVGNCVKRVAVIVSSIIFFQTPVSPKNALGTGFALAGVYLYSRTKRIKPKDN